MQDDRRRLALSVFRDQCPPPHSPLPPTDALVLSRKIIVLPEDIAAGLPSAAAVAPLQPQLASRNTLSANRGRKRKRNDEQLSLEVDLFPCMIGWKKHAHVSKYWWSGVMDKFHDGYFRRCAVQVSLCLLRFGPLIVQRWLDHNPDSYTRRNGLDGAFLANLKKWTKQHVCLSSFHVIARCLELLSLDVIINTGLAWLRADIADSSEIWMEQFVVRVFPLFLQSFFIEDAPTTPCRQTGATLDKLIPHLEFTWVKSASIHPINLWSTMKLSYPHPKNIEKETLSIPLLGVRQFLAKGGGRSLSSSADVVQTRSGARKYLVSREMLLRQQEEWFQTYCATLKLPCWIPSFQSSISLFLQFAKTARASSSSSSSPQSQPRSFRDYCPYEPFPTGMKRLLKAYRPASASAGAGLSWKIKLDWTKRCLRHAEEEWTWAHLLALEATMEEEEEEEEHEKEEESSQSLSLPWIPFHGTANADSSAPFRMRAVYCFCQRHALPLLKRITFFTPIYGYVGNRIVDAKGIDITFLDECGGGGGGGQFQAEEDPARAAAKSPRPCMARFFETCHCVGGGGGSAGSGASVFTDREKDWEFYVTPMYSLCCVFKNNEVVVFQLQGAAHHEHPLHVFSSMCIAKYEFRLATRTWHKMRVLL